MRGGATAAVGGGAGRAAAGGRAAAAGGARQGAAWPAGGGFGLGLGGGPAAAAAGATATHTGGAGAPVGVLGLLAVQGACAASAPAAAGSAARDAASFSRAEAMLDDLGALQRSLLGGAGGGSDALLRRMAGRLRDGAEEAADPGLRDAVRAVALRAEIELARRGWGASASAR